ncbi:unnamed protein product, partial [marine sediment metagenome]
KGSIKGKALLADAEDHSGIMVSVYGTSFIAVTDTNGSYKISLVKPGTYTLKAEKEGYSPAEQEGVEVKTGETTGVPELTLDPFINSPPSISSASIGPTTAYETTILSATASGWEDPDGDPPGYLYQWFKNDSSGMPGDQTVDGAFFDKGDTLYCAVFPFDGVDYGDPR